MEISTLVLFDIDGTLLRGGPAKEAFRIALLEVFGTAGRAAEWEFSGKTDPQIARELMLDAGVSSGRVDHGLEVLWQVYLREMESRIAGDPPEVLPGVHELLGALGEVEGAMLGLVTGNIAAGAAVKLRSANLAERFPIGAFGSDHEERNHLPRVAIQRAEEQWGTTFAASRVVVIGDTPRDVACGRHAGARTVGVATGRFGIDDLAGAGADRVYEDLSDVEELLGTILDRNGSIGSLEP